MSENPLVKALPPQTDYLSYLTLLEYNLTQDQLPTLHDLLQDTTLTTNIGWDLVHLLLPLLPESKLCLQDVARLGNPREVVLKVTELLEHLGLPDEDVEEQEDDEDGDPSDDVPTTSLGDIKLNEEEKNIAPPSYTKDTEATPPSDAEPPKPPSKALKFRSLVLMLQTLHPRIKTKYPSRFLSTSLQAILPAYASTAHDPEVTEAVITFVKSLSGTSRPKLPPRMSSISVLAHKEEEPESAPDPEGNDGSVGSDEENLQTRLLQSFLTYVIEAYMVSLPAVEDGYIPGLAWSSRLQEKLHPEKNIPGRRTLTDIFALSDLHSRDTMIGQLAALARDLSLTSEELLATITKPDEDPSSPIEDLPSSASDVPLSRPGSLYLFAVTAAAFTLFDAPTSLPSLTIFPQFSTLLPTFIGVSTPSSAGSEPPSLIDAVLFLGAYIVSTASIYAPESDEAFNETIQRLSLLSANTPVSSLRFHAHQLTAEILHSHPKEEMRLAYIKDTLKHCPYENLKASAVGWLKTELLIADKAYSAVLSSNSPPEVRDWLFATPVALTSLSYELFTIDNIAEEPFPEDSMRWFSNLQPFWLAVLNLLYLILCSPSLSQNLQIDTFLTKIFGFADMLSKIAVAAAEMAKHVEGWGHVEQEAVLLGGVAQMLKGKLDERGSSPT